MEVLIQTLLRTFCVGVIAFSAKGQTFEQMQSAFKTSYAHESKKEYSEAIQDLSSVYKEENYELNLRLGWLHYLKANYERSANYYRIAIKLRPAATEPLWGLLKPLSASKDWVGVESVYLKILKLDPANSYATYHLGLVYYYRKNYSKAKTYLDKSLNLNPFDYNCLLTSAWNNYFLGNYSEAKVLFQKVLLNNPGDASALEGLSSIK